MAKGERGEVMQAPKCPVRCDRDSLRALVYGGAIMGGGGGGLYREGLEAVDLALGLGKPAIVSLDELDPSSMVATVSAVGAPAAKQRHLDPLDFVRALELLIENTPDGLDGIISSEMGGRASANGLIQSAVLGLPLVDAPADGRAHPLGMMGGLGLHHRDGYVSVQAACGGDPDQGRRVEMLVRGDLRKCGALVRQASIQAGGVVAVARNPVSVSWLQSHGAVGALARTQAIGRKYLDALEKGRDVAESLAKALGGEVIARASVNRLEIQTAGGLDIGNMRLSTGHHLAIWNEYMTLELSGERFYSFPDLITSIDGTKGLPVNTCQLQQGMEITLIGASCHNLILGAGTQDDVLLTEVEEALGVRLR
ncbi:MAG: DUF917 family protein [Proteobacteria bacterium]|nr:DUF917 family protein [Pseudomonadota bacterium]MBU1740551.1 DUF917 family protein [Pseudomonadota bacterium]